MPENPYQPPKEVGTHIMPYLLAIVATVLLVAGLFALRAAIAYGLGPTEGDVQLPAGQVLLINVISLLTGHWWIVAALTLAASLGIAALFAGR